jgi:hypothetical protein
MATKARRAHHDFGFSILDNAAKCACKDRRQRKLRLGKEVRKWAERVLGQQHIWTPPCFQRCTIEAAASWALLARWRQGNGGKWSARISEYLRPK